MAMGAVATFRFPGLPLVSVDEGTRLTDNRGAVISCVGIPQSG